MNQIILVGHLGKNPEIRFTSSGTAVANLSVATNSIWKDNNGERQQRTEWHKVVVFGRLAEACGEYLKKGRLIEVSGELRNNKWTDRDGNQRVTTYINANHVGFLGGEVSQPEEVQACIEETPEIAEAQVFEDDNIPF